MSDPIDNPPSTLDDFTKESGAFSMRSSNATAQTGGSRETEHGTGLDAQSSISAPESLLSDNNSEAAAGNPLPAHLARDFEAALQKMRDLAQQVREAEAVEQVAAKRIEFYDAYGVWQDIAVKAMDNDYIIEERFRPDSIFEDYKDDGLNAQDALIHSINKEFEEAFMACQTM